MKLRTQIILISAAILLGVAVVGYYIIQKIEVVKEVHTGFKGEARTNPYLAVERLLGKRDFKVHHIFNEYQLNNLLNNKGTIFFLTDRETYKQQTMERLRQWVSDGGNLVANMPFYLLGDKEYYQDIIAEYLGVDFKKNPDINYIGEESGKEGYAIEVMLPGIEKKLFVTLDNSLVLNDTKKSALWSIEQNGNTLLLQFRFGQGYVTLTGSLSFMRNTRIGEKDNAALFWYLITLGSERSNVLFITRNESVSFWDVLFHNTWMFLVSLFILLLCFIWKSSMRFGPLISVIGTVRRSLIEHVYASGHFLWNKKQGPTLIKALKQAVKNKIKTRLPFWDTLSIEDQVELLKERTELEEEVLSILFISETRKELTKKSFYNKAKLIERIYEKV